MKNGRKSIEIGDKVCYKYKHISGNCSTNDKKGYNHIFTDEFYTVQEIKYDMFGNPYYGFKERVKGEERIRGYHEALYFKLYDDSIEEQNYEEWEEI